MKTEIEQLVSRILGGSATIKTAPKQDLELELGAAMPIETPALQPTEVSSAEAQLRNETALSKAAELKAAAQVLTHFTPASRSNSWEEAVEASANLDELRLALAQTCLSPLQKTAINTVFSDGSATAEAAIVGEAPGADEDRLGKPFVGRSGKLLDQAFQLVGLSRKKNIYITNLVPWRPPGNRTPTEQEIAYFLPYLKKHLGLTKAKYVLLLGAVATSALINFKTSLSKLRGKAFQVEINGRSITAVVTYHPAYLLRQPSAKKLFWSDLLYFCDLMARGKVKSIADNVAFKK